MAKRSTIRYLTVPYARMWWWVRRSAQTVRKDSARSVSKIIFSNLWMVDTTLHVLTADAKTSSQKIHILSFWKLSSVSRFLAWTKAKAVQPKFPTWTWVSIWLNVTMQLWSAQTTVVRKSYLKKTTRDIRRHASSDQGYARNAISNFQRAWSHATTVFQIWKNASKT